MDTDIKFLWAAFYEELATKLLIYKNNRTELLTVLKVMFSKTTLKFPFIEKGAVLDDICPFTVFGCFNKNLTNDKRTTILRLMKEEFKIQAEVPVDYLGIPILNAIQAWFFGWKEDRNVNDIQNLWDLFEVAIQYADTSNNESKKKLEDLFNIVIKQKCVSWNITMGLYWIRPNTFLNLDTVNRTYIMNCESGINLPVQLSRYNPPTASDYMIILDYFQNYFYTNKDIKDYLSLSYISWLDSNKKAKEKKEGMKKEKISLGYLVGALWGNEDLTDEFIDSGTWENGYTDKYLDIVKGINVGDKIAIKSTFVQKDGLPFETNGNSVSVMAIKAIGTVTKNYDDGRKLDVDWIKLDEPKKWFLFTYRLTIWKVVARPDDWVYQALLDFTFKDVKQDMNKFLSNPTWSEKYGINSDEETEDSGLIKPGENILFYGVPGCGKSYTVKSQYCDNEKLMERVVFHPDYTYTDFVGQILPKIDANKNIEYRFIPGPFTRILKKCHDTPNTMYYLIIEEINRGNAPAILGDVFQLLDRDVTGVSEYGITNYDVAQEIYEDEEWLVKIPANLTILATMNTADQNVFTLDTAFKRRWKMMNIENNIAAAKHSDLCILGTDLTWGAFATKINEYIVDNSENSLSSEDKRLGAYFVGAEDLNDESFGAKILMYLWNDAFKFNHSAIFNERYKTLEMLIAGFKLEKFKVFKDIFSEVKNLFAEDALVDLESQAGEVINGL